MAQFVEFGIKIPAGATGNVKAICPQCTPHSRKPQNKNSKDLSVNIGEGIWNCHNCGWAGSLPKDKPERVYMRPTLPSSSIDPSVVTWFKGRGISAGTLKAAGVKSKMEYIPKAGKEMLCMAFPYFVNGELVNVKYRDTEKRFKGTTGAQQTVFNYDGASGRQVIAVTEGEIDALSVLETCWCTTGEKGVISVPNGASAGANQKLEYLDNSIACFEKVEKIIIATDADSPGFALKKELIRRLGRDKCFEIEYPEGCKDLNDVLMKFGSQAVLDVLNNAKPIPLEGILRLNDFRKELDVLYEKGYDSGVSVGYYDFDSLLNFSPGQLTVVTGIPNSGKSAFVDQILVRLASRHKWKIGVCSFENQPYHIHGDKLATCFIGTPLARRNPEEKMTKSEFAAAKDFLQEYFFWFKMKDEDLSIDGILSRAKALVKTHGINALLIDPYNYIEHKKGAGQSETEYISELLTKIDRFCEDYQVHVFLIAHPRKIEKDRATGKHEVPNLYDIAGSAHFYNKADNGITVYRDVETNLVTVYVQKVRFFMNGSRGAARFLFDPTTNRYKPEKDLEYVSEYQHQIRARVTELENQDIVDGLPF